MTPVVDAAHPAEDPLHHAFCILDSLRLQHRVRSNIRQGAVQQSSFQHPAGVASLQRNQHASLDMVGDLCFLVIRVLSSGALLHRWPLPERLLRVHEQPWSWGSQALAIPCNVEAFQAAVLLVNPADGRCTVLEGFFRLSSWSSTGLLLVQAPDRGEDYASTSDEEEPDPQPMSAIDAAGTVVCTASLFLPCSILVVQWSPDGRIALLHCSGPSFWLWDVLTGAVPQSMLTEEPPHFNIRTAAWSTDSRRLIFGAPYSDWVVVWSPQGQYLQATGSPSEIRSGRCPPVWGSLNRVAFLGRASPPFTGQEREILVCRVSSSGRLESFNRISIDHTHSLCSARALSPDGAMVAVDTLSEDRQQRGVAVISFDGRWQRLFLLPFSPSSLQWAANGASMLASSSDGRSHTLLDFA